MIRTEMEVGWANEGQGVSTVGDKGTWAMARKAKRGEILWIDKEKQEVDVWQK